ncbi:MAG: PIN domain-containing protein [Armatimonadota bacterium]|jgi:predicted nucleic acid-binding protein
MASACLVDANVLVYSVDRREHGKHECAAETLRLLQTEGMGGVSTQALAEFFSISTRRIPDPLTPTEAYERVVDLVDAFSVYGVTQAIVLEAARAARDHQMSYWDAQIWATAKLNQIPYVLSEDLQGWDRLEGIRFVNPLVKGFDLASLGISR